MILELLLLINSVRLNPLILDNDLSKIAEERAIEVYYNWSHNNWEKSFEKTNCFLHGETLAYGFRSPPSLHRAMMGSPSHSHVILSKNYSLIGIGEYKDVVVELFCGKINPDISTLKIIK